MYQGGKQAVKASERNPASNDLPPGVTEGQLTEAVLKSGYPLECSVAHMLSPSFWVQPEWSYVDPDTGQLRSLDLRAGLGLFELEVDQPRVRPRLDLLLECKQSTLPYIFFLTQPQPYMPYFPLFAGLSNNDTIAITTDDDPSTWNLPIAQCLALDDEPFVAKPPACCMTFAKCERKGKNLELSGSEPFNSLVLPLTKGMAWFRTTQAPPRTAVYFDCHLLVGIGVVDGPMMAVTPGEPQDVEATPWVRVLRHEAVTDADAIGFWERERVFALDVVHRDFLEEYIRSSVLPFARVFAERALKHQEELAEGRGFAAGMGKDSWGNIEARLTPSGPQATVLRTKAAAASIARSLSKTLSPKPRRRSR